MFRITPEPLCLEVSMTNHTYTLDTTFAYSCFTITTTSAYSFKKYNHTIADTITLNISKDQLQKMILAAMLYSHIYGGLADEKGEDDQKYEKEFEQYGLERIAIIQDDPHLK